MKWNEKGIYKMYGELDADENKTVQRRIYNQICAKKTSFKRKTIWGACAVAGVCVVFLICWLPIQRTSAYLPNPAEFNRMQFAFYRELALPGQNLGISLEELKETIRPEEVL